MRSRSRTPRRFRMLLGVLAVAGATCLAGVAAAQSPGQDSATGTFTVAGINFALDAHSGPSGENPGGTFVAPVGVFPVACLRVSGSTAVIGVNTGRFGSLVQVVDGPVDTFAEEFLLPPLGADGCGAPPVATPIPITSGDIVVVDAQPFPTLKDQCKSGGWRNYGDTFKN